MLLRRCLFLLVLLLVACQPLAPLRTPLPSAATWPPTSRNQNSSDVHASTPTGTSLPTSTEIAAGSDSTPLDPSIPAITPETYSTPGPPPLPLSIGLEPADWKNWPIVPIVTERARTIYRIGQILGNNAHAFSVLGDCQSEPKVFMGVYETDPTATAALSIPLMETVVWFTGSFNRKSPTVRGGTTTAALLWSAWHQNKYTCTIYESPLTCELRIHKPAFVIIHVGTHYETGNVDYMRMILDQLIAAGVVPILTSKADDRELDDHVNTGYAQLAAEYNIPFWNFWAAVEALPNRGLYTRPDAVYQGDLYLIEEALAIHRLSALQTLDAVRRAVAEP